MSHHREILAALERLRSGARTLTAEQYVALLDALEQAAEALHLAPRGSDPVATGLWWHHERAPALARLADALTRRDLADAVSPDKRGARRAGAASAVGAEREEPSDLEVAQALHRSLLESPRR